MSKEKIEELLAEHGDIIVFDDSVEVGRCYGDDAGVPDVYFRSPRDENGRFAIGCRQCGPEFKIIKGVE